LLELFARSRNDDVPLMIVAVGEADDMERGLARAATLLRDPIATIERIRLCKRAGVRLDEPRPLPAADEEGVPLFQKLMLYAGEQARFERHALYVRVIRELRPSGAARPRRFAASGDTPITAPRTASASSRCAATPRS
jgi:hypothetical protein